MEHYELYRDEELVQMYRDGDERAVEAIMERYKNFVSKKAHAMYIVGGEMEDLIQEGMIGLYKAVTAYDKTKAASFMTFASLWHKWSDNERSQSLQCQEKQPVKPLCITG